MKLFRARTLAYAALTANAIKPLPGFRTGIGAFIAGDLVNELAPHWLGITTADAAVNAFSRNRDTTALALAAASAAGLGYLVVEARRDQKRTEDALVEGLGADYAEQLDALPTPAELKMPWRRMVNPFRMRDAAVKVERGISYGPAGRRNTLDVYLPADQDITDAPVLLQIHGGAWTFGTKETQGIPLMHRMAGKGWVVVAINYRLSPRDRWPAQVEDVKRAVAWIREHISEYGGDPSYVAITGGSAGGHLAALTALTPHEKKWQPGFEGADTTIQAAVPVYGVYDLAGSTGTKAALKMRDLFLAPRVMQSRWDEEPELFEDASPILRITPEAPDFFILHGARDTLVPVDQARQFVARLRGKTSASVVYAELPGAQHAFDLFPSIRSEHIIRAVDRYLHWHWNAWRTARGAEVADPQG